MRSAARITDLADCHGLPVRNATVPWARDVLIAGVPAARYLDNPDCGGFIVTGDPTVLIAGLPAARVQDRTSDGGSIVSGDPGTLLSGQVFEDSGINDLIRQIDDARENVRQLERRAAEARRIAETLARESMDRTRGVGGWPENPRENIGPSLGRLAGSQVETHRAMEAERQAEVNRGEVRELERQLISEAQHRISDELQTPNHFAPPLSTTPSSGEEGV